MLSVYELRRRLFSDKLIVAGAGRIALGAKYMFDFKNERYIGIKGESNADILVADAKREIDANDVGDECKRIINHETGYFIVVCSYHEEDVSRSLVNAGFNTYEDFISVFDLAKLLDFPNAFYQRENASILIDKSEKSKIHAFNINKHYDTDFSLITLDELKENKTDRPFLLIVSDRSENIRKCLELGYVYNRDLFVLDNDDKRPSVFFRKLSETSPFNMPKCEHPFSFIEIIPSKDSRGVSAAVMLCCPVFIRESAGYLRDSDFCDIWRSNIAKLQRLSCIDRSYYFCDTKHCRYLKSKFDNAVRLPMDAIVNEQDYATKCPDYPFHVAVDIDQTCNLYCKYCRNEIYKNNDKETYSLEVVTDKIIKELVPNCGELMLAGNGEVFASKYYKKMLYAPSTENGKKTKLQLTTNALLLNENRISELIERYSHIELWISIDAASKEAYEDVRRGGTWETLLKNLEIVKKYRLQNKLHYVRFNFIVTAKSCDEMKDFVNMAKHFAADSVLFQRVEHVGVMPDEEYEQLSIFDSAGDIKKEYVHILDEPIFNDPIINRQNNIFG